MTLKAESSDDEWVEKQEETQEEQTTSNETADIGVAEKQLLDENETQSKVGFIMQLLYTDIIFLYNNW